MQMWAVVDLVIDYINIALLQLPRGLIVAFFANLGVVVLFNNIINHSFYLFFFFNFELSWHSLICRIYMCLFAVISCSYINRYNWKW